MTTIIYRKTIRHAFAKLPDCEFHDWKDAVYLAAQLAKVVYRVAVERDGEIIWYNGDFTDAGMKL